MVCAEKLHLVYTKSSVSKKVSHMKKIYYLAIVLLLSACGTKIDGTYVGKGMFSASSFTFQSNGKVVVNNMGIKAEAPYEIDGDKIKIMAMGGVIVTLKKDGSFDLPGAGTYTKQ